MLVTKAEVREVIDEIENRECISMSARIRLGVDSAGNMVILIETSYPTIRIVIELRHNLRKFRDKHKEPYIVDIIDASWVDCYVEKTGFKEIEEPEPEAPFPLDIHWEETCAKIYVEGVLFYTVSHEAVSRFISNNIIATITKTSGTSPDECALDARLRASGEVEFIWKGNSLGKTPVAGLTEIVSRLEHWLSIRAAHSGQLSVRFLQHPDPRKNGYGTLNVNGEYMVDFPTHAVRKWLKESGIEAKT